MLRTLLTAGWWVIIGMTATIAVAGGTSPTLVLSSASGAVSGGGRLAEFEGTFDTENAIQVGYDIELVLFQGTTFARYPMAAPALAGSTQVLADGVLDEADLSILDVESGPVPAGVRIVALTRSALGVTLPPGFTGGLATAVVVAHLDEGPVFSNPIDFSLP